MTHTCQLHLVENTCGSGSEHSPQTSIVLENVMSAQSIQSERLGIGFRVCRDRSLEQDLGKRFGKVEARPKSLLENVKREVTAIVRKESVIRQCVETWARSARCIQLVLAQERRL